MTQKQPSVIEVKDEYNPVYELPKDYRKLVVFVGPNKSGTTFMSNAVSYAISSKGIPTALVDLTRDRGIYYIHTQDNDKLRKIASTCMQNLSNGVDIPIQTSKNKNLSVYTAVPGAPGDDRRLYKHKVLLDTLKQRNNLVILDCDFTTPYDYFEQASEIYIVQDMDVLKMQDTTMFLRELKNRKTDMQKIRVIINKYVKATLTPKTIIEVGLSYYNDPSMSFVDTLLPNRVLYSVVPYDLDNYRKYIEILFAANGLDFSNFSQEFLNAIEEITQQVYPIGKNNNIKKRRGIFG
jgi:MinD-like ATPase involved in chromosome partitioning or flagellar assembly